MYTDNDSSLKKTRHSADPFAGSHPINYTKDIPWMTPWTPSRRVHRLTVLNSPFLGPFKILLKVNDNHGTVHSLGKIY